MTAVENVRVRTERREETVPARREARRPSLLRRAAAPLGALVVGLVSWQLAIILFDIPSYMLPSPTTLAETAWENRTQIWEPTFVTLRESVFAFLAATVVGIVTALVMARWGLAERAMYPYLIVLQTIPIIAIAPLFVVWIGAGETTNVVIGAMLAVFPVVANTLHGLKSVDRNLVQLYKMAGAPPRTTLLSLRLPGATPSILTGMRVAAGTAVIGAIVGEFVAGVGGGKGGLGYIITQSAIQMRIPQLFVAALMASAISLVLFAAVVALEKALLSRWHESALPDDE